MTYQTGGLAQCGVGLPGSMAARVGWGRLSEPGAGSGPCPSHTVALPLPLCHPEGQAAM